VKFPRPISLGFGHCMGEMKSSGHSVLICPRDKGVLGRESLGVPRVYRHGLFPLQRIAFEIGLAVPEMS
jgi:hypothetical protein